jgi:sigma-B regulation protein RsbU (phosphoserine phosphatase)
VSQGRAGDAFHQALQGDDPVELYEQAPCGYLTTDADGRIVKANRTFLTLTGYQAGELADRPLADLLTPGGRIFQQTHLMPMLRMHGEAREIALDLVNVRGEVLPVLLNATTDLQGGERPQIRIAVFDATERRSYERELLAAKERAEASERHARDLARTLQQTLIPPSLPDVPGLEIATRYRPAGDGTEVGGDFYDVFPVGDGTWTALLGDVCGKGVEAAVVTALARHTIRALSSAHERPSDVLTRLNEVLIRDSDDRFCTVLLVSLRPAGHSWRATISVGGHPAPVLVGPDAPPAKLDASGPLVGILPDAEFHDHELDLAPGQTLVAYTDGITEARGPDGYYGEQRMLRTLGTLGLAPEAMVDGLLADAVAFQGPSTRDDIAVLALGAPREPARVGA